VWLPDDIGIAAVVGEYHRIKQSRAGRTDLGCLERTDLPSGPVLVDGGDPGRSRDMDAEALDDFGR